MLNDDKISDKHKKALQWFVDNARKEVPWPQKLDGDVFLFCKPRGIYKPKDSPYALSIRHTPNTLYKDEDPVFNDDGSWSYIYHQEEQKNNIAESLFTNRALLACMNDGVPVGVALKIAEKPNIRYHILGLAQIKSIKNGLIHLVSYSSKNEIASQKKIDHTISSTIQDLIEPTFEPNSNEDARKKTLRQIVERRGQKKFRDQLLKDHQCTCAITGCKVKSALEAAHITPYLGPHTNHPSNGLLLRADIHTLWDLGLIAINPQNMQIVIGPELKGSEYEIYQNQMPKINLQHNQLSEKALYQQFELLKSEENHHG